eukprot:SAG22_NODE_1969_length_3234_cov_2.212759_6_plen_97_part_00
MVAAADRSGQLCFAPRDGAPAQSVLVVDRVSIALRAECHVPGASSEAGWGLRETVTEPRRPGAGGGMHAAAHSGTVWLQPAKRKPLRYVYSRTLLH